jgi:predicted 3-demethylubiquinone-9 3-methyltransferase (glyoxalase superfamily)
MAQVQSITPCLWFNGQAEAAARFYASVFPDSRVLELVRWPEGATIPGGAPAGSVLTVRFQLAGQEFIALNGGPQFSFDEAVSFSVRCETQDEVDRYWRALGEGGSYGPCGWLKDRYGLWWQVVPTVLIDLIAGPDAARAAKVLNAMMTMGKLEIAPLLAAAEAG